MRSSSASPGTRTGQSQLTQTTSVFRDSNNIIIDTVEFPKSAFAFVEGNARHHDNGNNSTILQQRSNSPELEGAETDVPSRSACTAARQVALFAGTGDRKERVWLDSIDHCDERADVVPSSHRVVWPAQSRIGDGEHPIIELAVVNLGMATAAGTIDAETTGLPSSSGRSSREERPTRTALVVAAAPIASAALLALDPGLQRRLRSSMPCCLVALHPRLSRAVRVPVESDIAGPYSIFTDPPRMVRLSTLDASAPPCPMDTVGDIRPEKSSSHPPRMVTTSPGARSTTTAVANVPLEI